MKMNKLFLKGIEMEKIKVYEKCDKCDQESTKLTRCKIYSDEGKYEPILNVCDACMKKYDYTEYDGSDWVSDWN